MSCVIDTITKAKARRKLDQPLLIHSDRGSQYVAAEYRKATAKMQRSYSKKAYPWDNACIESFHALIKREWLNRFRFMTFSRYTVSYLNTSRLFTIRFGLTVIADIFRRINLKGYTKQWHKARNISQLTLTMRINFSF